MARGVWCDACGMIRRVMERVYEGVPAEVCSECAVEIRKLLDSEAKRGRIPVWGAAAGKRDDPANSWANAVRWMEDKST